MPRGSVFALIVFLCPARLSLSLFLSGREGKKEERITRRGIRFFDDRMHRKTKRMRCDGSARQASGKECLPRVFGLSSHYRSYLPPVDRGVFKSAARVFICEQATANVDPDLTLSLPPFLFFSLFISSIITRVDSSRDIRNKTLCGTIFLLLFNFSRVSQCVVSILSADRQLLHRSAKNRRLLYENHLLFFS